MRSLLAAQAGLASAVHILTMLEAVEGAHVGRKVVLVHLVLKDVETNEVVNVHLQFMLLFHEFECVQRLQKEE